MASVLERMNSNDKGILGAFFRASKLYFAPAIVLWNYAKQEITREYGPETPRNPEGKIVPAVDDSANDLALMREAICYNQSAIIEYSVSAAQKNVALMDALKTESKGTLSRTERVSRALINLVEFLNVELRNSSVRNFDFMHSYFKRRGDLLPRVCIKGNFRQDGRDRIIQIFRDEGSVPYNSTVEVEGNTGFQSIKEKGTFFLENNIPRAVIENRYINPRLEVARIHDAFREGGLAKVVDDWDGFWTRRSTLHKSPRSYYKSTLIIPITLWNNALTEEFKKTFKDSGIKNVERLILGYLCFDHRDIGFFNDKSDVAMGYIFADLLSIYLFTRLTHTDSSPLYREAKDFLQGKSGLPDVKAPQSLDVLTGDPSPVLGSHHEKSRANDLVPADHFLKKFSEELNKLGLERTKM